MSFSYVILHYKNIKDTVKCIESLLETAGRDSKLIVVDNGSNDNSGIELKDKYSGSEQVEVLLLPENLGFPREIMLATSMQNVISNRTILL